MDIKKLIIESDYFGQAEGKAVAQLLAESPDELEAFINDFLENDGRFRQRASWVLVALAKNHEPKLLSHLGALLASLENKPVDGIKRNVLRILELMALPSEVHEQLINYCFDLLYSKEEAIAVQVFAMSVLNNLLVAYPELQRELVLLLEDKLDYASAGYKSRAKKIIAAYHKKSR